MTLFLLRRALVLGVALMALPVAAQTTFTVNSTADDDNARDANRGDGQCVDAFTQSNPSAEPRCTLRAAIDEANMTSGEVIINLPGQLTGGASGSYTLSRVAPDMASNTYEDDNAYGDLDIGGSFSSLTIRGTATPGPQITIGPNDRVFHLLSGEVTIERVTITGGTAQPGDNGVSSPGMDEMVDGANGADGGCLLIASGVTAMLNQVSVNNCATSSGGNGAAPATADTAGGNAGNGGNGGGIANFGTLTLRKSFVAQNGTGDAGSAGNGTAGGGGAVAGGNGGNGGNGGGVFNAGTLTVEQSTVTGNTAGDPSTGATGTNGGDDGADGEGGSGGGIATLDGGTVDLSSSIVADNSAGDDVNNPEMESGPEATKQPGSDLFNGSLADDDEVSGGFEAFTPGTFTAGGYNLIGTNNSVEDTFSAGMPNGDDSFVGTGQGDASTRIDPVITGSNRNETYAVTAYELGSGSPAINAGDPAIGQDQVTIDGRGFRRPGTAGGDDRADIGAFEFDSMPIMGQLVINELDSVTAPADEQDGAEFVEIRNTGMVEAQLGDYALVFYSGEDDQSYAAVDLTGTLAPGASITIGDADIAEQSPDLFSGATDNVRDEDGAVGIYLGGSTDFPNGSAAGQNASTRVDVLVYDNGTQASRRMDAGSLAGAFGVSEDMVASGDTDEASIQRNGNGTYTAGAPTPGGNTMSGNAATDVVINEVDADTEGSDTEEFVELWDGGRGNTSLDGLVLVAVNGTVTSGDGLSYDAIDLDGFTTDASGFFVVGDLATVAGADDFGIQNGADAVALYQGNASDFPNDTDVSGVAGATLLDVVVYGTGQGIDQTLLDEFTYTQGRNARVQYEEGFAGDKDVNSLQRINDPAMTDGYSQLFYTATPTPGAANISEITVDKTDEVADEAGWRMLSSPVISSGTGVDSPARTPLRVDFYAENVNLVQGVAAGNSASLYQAQYPDGDDVLFDDYLPDGSYAPAESTSDELAPGSGFYWYWYDNDVVPDPGSFGGGTSRSYDLGGAEFSLAVTGLPLDDRIASSALGTMGLQVTRTVGMDGFVMLGNPYAYPYYLSGLTVDQGALSTAFSAWDPAADSYVTFTANADAPDGDNSIEVWQGVFAEVAGQEGNDVTFSAPSDAVVPTLDAESDVDGVYRTARVSSEGQLRLSLTGQSADGVAFADVSPLIRFLDGASAGWDRHDGSKLMPPTASINGQAVALLAPTGTRDDVARRQSAFSLPPAFGAADVPLALLAPAGTYAIGWDGTALPDGFSGTLVDHRTGARVSLGTGGTYEFAVTDDTDWTERFTLSMTTNGTDTEGPLAGLVEVSPAYPNPTTRDAALDLRVARAQPVTVELFDALGRRVALAHSGDVIADQRLTVSLPTADLAPGVYVVRVAGESFQESRRLTVIR